MLIDDFVRRTGRSVAYQRYPLFLQVHVWYLGRCRLLICKDTLPWTGRRQNEHEDSGPPAACGDVAESGRSVMLRKCTDHDRARLLAKLELNRVRIKQIAKETREVYRDLGNGSQCLPRTSHQRRP